MSMRQIPKSDVGDIPLETKALLSSRSGDSLRKIRQLSLQSQSSKYPEKQNVQ